MLDTSFLFKSLNAQVSKMITEVELIKSLTDHPGEKGRENEGVLRNCLETMLPRNWEISTGFVVNPKTSIESDEKTSGQTDIMIYNSHAAPPIFTGYQNSIIPIHSLACAIEVKKKLKDSKQLLKECLKPADRIKKLYNDVKQENSGMDKPFGNAPYNILFCYESSMELGTIVDTLDNRQDEESGERYTAALDLVVVLNRGIVYRNETKYYSAHASVVEGTKFKETKLPKDEARPWVFNEFYAELVDILYLHEFPYYQNQRWSMK